MSAYCDESVREDYKKDIALIRDRHGDEIIVDWIERYYADGDVDRDDVMEALGIDYVGTFYELVDEARQAEMMRLLRDGKEVPENLRKPASWKRQVN